MRVRVKKALKYDDLRKGQGKIPAGKYLVKPLLAGKATGDSEIVAYKFKGRNSKDVYRLEARTFKAWKKSGDITDL
jgi:hypothetical protein